MAGKLTNDTCADCRFAFSSTRQYAELECRRMPPIMVQHMSSCAKWMAPGWPDIQPSQWCGEYKFSGREALSTTKEAGDGR